MIIMPNVVTSGPDNSDYLTSLGLNIKAFTFD